jgi:hypothetical protein
MSEPTSSFAIVWKVLVKLFPSITGSFIAVLTMKYSDTTTKKKMFAALVAFVTGIAMSHFVGEAIIGYYPGLLPVTQDGIKFALGIFGLTLINNVLSEVGPWFLSLRKKIFGAENV